MRTHFRALILLVFAGFLLICNSCKKDKEKSSYTPAVNLYATDYWAAAIYKIDLVNSPNTLTTLFDNSDGVAGSVGITLTNDGYLIAAEEANNTIIKMQKNGSGTIEVLYDGSDGVDEPDAITVDNATHTIYWTNSGTGQVMKGSTDGSTAVTTLYSGTVVFSSAYGIAIDKSKGKLYICDFNEYIKVGKLDGTGTMTVLWDNTKYPDMSTPSNICLDAAHGKIYWGDESSDAVVEANLDGTGTPKVLFDASDGVNRADGVYVDYADKKIYWTETDNTTFVIARGNLDGTGDREVLTDNVESYGMILEFE